MTPNLIEHIRTGSIVYISVQDARGYGSGADEFNPLSGAHLPKSSWQLYLTNCSDHKMSAAAELGRVGLHRLDQSVLPENRASGNDLVRPSGIRRRGPDSCPNDPEEQGIRGSCDERL